MTICQICMTSYILFLSEHRDWHLIVFSSAETFRIFYRETCYKISKMLLFIHEDSLEIMLSSDFLKMIEHQLMIVIEKLIQKNDIISTKMHCKILWKLQSFWCETHSDCTCFVCIKRWFQYNLSYKHSVCKTCVWILINWYYTDS